MQNLSACLETRSLSSIGMMNEATYILGKPILHSFCRTRGAASEEVKWESAETNVPYTTRLHGVCLSMHCRVSYDEGRAYMTNASPTYRVCSATRSASCDKQHQPRFDTYNNVKI